jgi:myosin-1
MMTPKKEGPDYVEDLVMMEELTEDSLITNLNGRFDDRLIYTWVGRTLVSINPYQDLGLYGEQIIEQYARRAAADPEGLPPHVYATAHYAYEDMLQSRRSQAICNSGESGSGNTEATQIALASPPPPQRAASKLP